ncbi:MAG: hypothetical protein RIN55_07905 [Tissierellaceae bacterium]|nr:hypothetical protein [Tissierellaceae bacterium]
MKKIIFILIMLLPLVLSACTIADSNIQDKIASPENNTTPIQGKWVIDEVVISAEDEVTTDDSISNDVVEEESYLGREILFNKNAIVVADDYAENPTFKFKNVNTNDYLLYKYKVNPSSLNIQSENIQVITSLKDNQLFYEFVRYNEDNLLIYIDNAFYKLTKIADEVSSEEVNRYISIENNMMRTFDTIEVEDINSGVLLGIKTPTYDEENEISDWEYKTIWIKSENRNITKYELDKLLVPRKNGFWLVGVDRVKTDISINDKIFALPQFRRIDLDEAKLQLDNVKEQLELALDSFSKPLDESQESIALVASKPTILKDILFIGNDYISIEKTEVDNKNKKTLEVYALDNIEEERPIKLSDIVEDGEFLFNEGSQNIQSLGQNVIRNQFNVGLIRKNGYWILKGRINYQQKEEELYKDFNIKAIPPKAMVSYDELSIPWDIINTQFPGAVDVFSSPNGEFIIIVTSNELQIYPTENGELLSIEPISNIQLPNNASIIMSEWATGRYPNIWENEMINQGASIID